MASEQFTTKDSGRRVDFPSGMQRDVQDGKPRYDLIPLMPLRRLAELYARGAEKYGDSNYQLANSPEELQRFKASAWRHFVQYMDGQRDEDHGIAAVWNLFACLELEEKLAHKVVDDAVDRLEYFMDQYARGPARAGLGEVVTEIYPGHKVTTRA